ncbi:uncharacterized protein ACMZJ9_018830 [Mantella aurantiaca]
MVPSTGLLLVLVGVFFILIHAGPISFPECPPDSPEAECNNCPGNKTYGCGGRCPKTCTNLNDAPKACLKDCRFGCICKSEYVYLSDEDRSRCILPKDCPRF